MATAVIGALGFEEKFLARCMMRAHGHGGLRSITLFVPTPSDDYSARRTESAFSTLRKLAEEYMGGVRVERVFVDPLDFWGCVSRVRRLVAQLLDEGFERVVLCIASGMRVLVAALIVGALTLPRGYDLSRVAIEADLESGTGTVVFSAAQVRSLGELSATEERVLRLLSERGSLRLGDIARLLDMPKSTAWRALSNLEKRGLVARRPSGIYEALVRL